MMNKEELDKKLAEIHEAIGGKATVDVSYGDLEKFFKKSFNDEMFAVGRKVIIDLSMQMKWASNKAWWRKRFKNNPYQPVTITYRRLDLIFYTYDNFPEYEEEYISTNGDNTNKFYIADVKVSEIFKGKEYLKETKPNEWYLQTHLVDFKGVPGVIITDDINI